MEVPVSGQGSEGIFPPRLDRNAHWLDDFAPTEGVEWAGLCFGLYSAVCSAFSFALPSLAARIGRRGVHALCLICGSFGLLSVVVIHDKSLLYLSMSGVGIAWASTLSMPYAILSASLGFGWSRISARQ